jgi:hypothetical protein
MAYAPVLETGILRVRVSPWVRGSALVLVRDSATSIVEGWNG